MNEFGKHIQTLLLKSASCQPRSPSAQRKRNRFKFSLKGEPNMSTEVLEHEVPLEINKYDFRTESKPVFRAQKGLNAEIVSQISEMKNEPDWMRQFRLGALETLFEKKMPKWGGDLC